MAIPVSAQQRPSALSAGFMPGFIISHTNDLKNIQSHTLAFELQYELDQSKTHWGRHYRRPIAGFGLSFFDFGMERSGEAIAVQGNVKFRLYHRDRNALSFRLGSGIAYLTKVFDVENNLRNQAIGSHFNGFMQTAMLYEHRFEQSELTFGLALSHFSNGAFRMPNLGLNLPSLMFKYSRDLKWTVPDMEARGIDPWWKDSSAVNPWSVSAGFILTGKERTLANPVRFTIFGLQLRALNRRTVRNTWRVGFDIMADKTYAYVNDVQVNLDSISYFSQLEIGIAGGRSWSFGKLQVVLEAGTYLARPGSYKRRVYERMGFTYHLTEHLGLRGSLKFHRAVADYFEWGLLYNINL